MRKEFFKCLAVVRWLVVAGLVGGVPGGCVSPSVSTMKQAEALPTKRTGLPLSRGGGARATFDVPEGWRITATGPRAGCEVDYVMRPDGDAAEVTISLARCVFADEQKAEQKLARSYLDGLRKLMDKQITMRRLGTVKGRGEEIGLYLYHSDYWRYRVAAFFPLAGSGYVQAELYAPTEEETLRYVEGLKKVAGSLRER